MSQRSQFAWTNPAVKPQETKDFIKNLAIFKIKKYIKNLVISSWISWNVKQSYVCLGL